MGRRLSPKQLREFKKIIQGKRVLDVGDENSQFLAMEFARFAKTWTVVGRPAPPSATAQLPPSVTVVPDSFEKWTERPAPTEFDVIVLPFPSPAATGDAQCLEWAEEDQMMVVFADPQDDSVAGSPDFWKLAREQRVQRDDRDPWSRMMVFQKTAAKSKKEEPAHKGSFPKKGKRYKLVPGFRWPGKLPGTPTPIVEISKNWEKNAGPAKIIGTGEVLRLHGYDLGAPM